MVFSGFQPDGHNEGALVRAGYHCSGLILQDHPVDATVDNAGMNAGLMVAKTSQQRDCAIPMGSADRTFVRAGYNFATPV